MLSASPSSRLITFTSTLIIPHITKTSSNNCLLSPLNLTNYEDEHKHKVNEKKLIFTQHYPLNN